MPSLASIISLSSSSFIAEADADSRVYSRLFANFVSLSSLASASSELKFETYSLFHLSSLSAAERNTPECLPPSPALSRAQLENHQFVP